MPYCDENGIVALRRRLHEYPEIGYDLEKTCKTVEEELDKLGLAYTDKYLRSSIVCDITVPNAVKTVAVRADMDALPVKECTGLPFQSKNEGKMHACGHDAHTAAVLGALKALYERKSQLACNVRFIFQPNEEGPDSAPEQMVPNGVLDGVDEILGFHVNNNLDCGKIGYCSGPFMASCRNFTVEVKGRSTHATSPQLGADALAAAAQIYGNLQPILTRQVSPLQTCVCSVCALHAGSAHNVVPDNAAMLGTLRTYDLALDGEIYEKICLVAKNTAECYGCTASVSSNNVLTPLVNDGVLMDKVMTSAGKIVGTENVVRIPPQMGSEDFADFSTVVPAAYFNLGTGKVGSENRPALHRSDFVIEESALKYAADTIVQYILDQNP